MIVYWPCEKFISFQDAVDEACACNGSLLISAGTRIYLTTTIVIKSKNCELKIYGATDGEPPIVESAGHCIFQFMGKKVRVHVENLVLKHVAESDDKKEIGAAVFCLCDSSIILQNCDVGSTNGFCVWTVQRSMCTIDTCTIRSTCRSGCVAFGKSSLRIESSSIEDCGQHGVCLRGTCSLLMNHTALLRCRVRAVYAYDKAHVYLQHCRITGTLDPLSAAIEIRSNMSTAACLSMPWHRPCAYGSSDRSQNVLSSLLLPPSTVVPNSRKDASPICPYTHVTMSNVCFFNNAGRDVACSGVSAVVSCRGCFRYCSLRDQCVPLRDWVEHGNDMAVPVGDTVGELLEHRDCITYISLLAPLDDSHPPAPPSECPGRSTGSFSSGMVWEYQRNDTQWVAYSSIQSAHLRQCFTDWRRYLGSPSCMQTGTSDDKHKSFAVGKGGEPDSCSLSLHKVRLVPPMEHYEVNMQSLHQINTRSFFVRAVRYYYS